MEAQKSSGKILQIGSAVCLLTVFQKAKMLLEQGAIGKLNMVEAWLDRNTAWAHGSIRFLPMHRPPRSIGIPSSEMRQSARLTRRASSAGATTGTTAPASLVTSMSTYSPVCTWLPDLSDPTKIYATGGLRYWKDGRDVPDVMLACMDYPDFTFTMKVNFKSGVPVEDFGFRFVGSEGVMWTSMSEVRVAKQPRESEPGFTIGEFAADVRKKYMEDYRKQYPIKEPTADGLRSNDQMRFAPPCGLQRARRTPSQFHQRGADS